MSHHLRTLRAPIVLLVLLSTAILHAQTMELTEPIAVSSFDPRATRLTPAQREQLTDAVRWMREHPWRLIVVEGYGDRERRPATNVRLGQDRADAVRSALIELGADPKRIIDAAYGETRSDDGLSTAGRVLVRGTLGDFRDLIASQRGRSL
jgi:outer membrane protein OmpA-like peptidoglycan-associated protein